MNADDTAPKDWLALDDSALLAECDIHIYKASGPGGQHRNKVSSAVRLRHRPTGITTHGDDSRSQHENKRLALRRLRREIACQIRRPADLEGVPAAIVAECLPGRTKRLDVGTKNERFWPLAQYMLDVLDATGGGLADAARHLGIGTSNFAAQLRKDRHLFAAAGQIRKRHGLGPIK